MEAILKITSDDLDEEKLQDLTRDLTRTLNRETDVEATLPEEAGELGDKGDPVTIGAIVLTALSSGTVVALFNVFRTYFERRQSLEVELARPDGKKFKLKAENLDEDEIERTVKLVNEFLGA